MSLAFNTIEYRYGSNALLKGVSLNAKAGEITCLLGPSGCGKTTLLRLAAGLLPVQAGSIVLDGETLATPGQDMPPEKRPVGLVFQDGALFPHLTVAENIAFGLRDRKGEAAARVDKLLALVGLRGFGERYPHTLSGGEQQRVALARALAPSPRVLLLDEPYANMDSQLRRQLREETRLLLKRTGTVVILVTHDPEEALEMGDHIAVLDEGLIMQCGTPAELYDAPRTLQVARLIGGGQILTGRLTPQHIETGFDRWPRACLVDENLPDGPVILVIRDGAIRFELAEDGLPVVDIRTAGAEQLVYVQSPTGKTLRLACSRQTQLEAGQTVELMPVQGAVFAFPDPESD